MVGVPVGHQDIHLSRGQAQLLEPGEQRLPAGLLPEPRIDEQGPVLPLDEVRVELFERIPGQGHGDPVDVFHDLLQGISLLIHTLIENRYKISQFPPKGKGRSVHILWKIRSGRKKVPGAGGAGNLSLSKKPIRAF